MHFVTAKFDALLHHLLLACLYHLPNCFTHVNYLRVELDVKICLVFCLNYQRRILLQCCESLILMQQALHLLLIMLIFM